MPFGINFSDYTSGGPRIGPVDAGAGLRALAEQNLKQQQMAENQRQFNTSSEQRQKEHADTVLHQKQVSHDINTRFASEQANQIQSAKVASSKARHSSVQKGLDDARKLVVSGKWNEALALIGSLKDQGADVSVDKGPDGKPIFNLKGSEYSGPELQGDFNSILGQVTGQPQPAAPSDDNALNPLDTGLGTSVSAANPDLPHPAATADGADTGYRTPTSTPPSVTSEPSVPDAGVDPRTLDTAQLQNWTNMRLDPVLSGIEGAIPGRFQGQANSLLQSFKSLGQTPEDTLKSLQNPFDTAAGLWKSQLGMEGQMARAGMNQGNQESNRDIRLEDRTWRRTQDIDKQWDLSATNRKYVDIDNIDRELAQNNPMADGQILHKVRGLFQSGVATQKDIDTVKQGIGKGILQNLADVTNEQILGTGLNPDSRAGLRQFLQSMKQTHATNIIGARENLNNLLRNVSSREEALSALQYMNTHIPRDLWTPEQIELQKQLSGDFNDKPKTTVPTVPGNTSSSASAKGRGAKASVSEPSELDEFLE